MPAFEAGTAFVHVVPSMRNFQNRIRQEMRRVSDFYVEVSADTSGLGREIDRVVERNRPEVTVGVHVDRAELDRAESEVDKMAGRVSDARKREADAAGQVRVVESRLAEVRSKAARDGSALAAAEERVAKARRAVEAASQNTVRLEREMDALRQRQRQAPPAVGMDTSEAVAKLVDLRTRMGALGNRTIGVDLSTGAAKLELTALRSELDRLGLAAPTVQVRADVMAALAELAGVESYIRRLDGRSVTVSVDDFGSAARTAAGIARVSAVLGLVGPAAFTAVGGLTALVGAAGVALGAIAPLILAFGGVGTALSAMGEQQDNAAAEAAQSAQQQAAAAYQVESAQLRLQQTHARVTQAREDGAESVAAAERQSAASIEQALDRARDAERNLLDAQRQAVSVQRELTTAREDARRQVEDLAMSVEDGALAERRAVLDVQSARADLNRTMSDTKATGRQRAESQLAYDEAAQQLDSIRLRNRRLAADKAAADRAGINGSAQVVAATARIEAANRRVTDARREAQRTDDAVDAARIEGVRRVGQAEADSARRVADAQSQVAEAQRALAQAMTQTGAQGAASVDKVAQAMGKLSPPAQEFVRYLNALKPELAELRGAAAAGVFPGMQQGIDSLMTRFDVIKRVIGQFGAAVGQSFAVLGAELASPYWTNFFTQLGNAAGTVLPALTQGFLGIGRGVADLVTATLPFANVGAQILTQLGGLLSALAPSFGQLAGVLGPLLAQFLQALQPAFGALGQVLVALAPAMGQLAIALANLITTGLQVALPYIQRFSNLIAANPERAAALVAALAGIGVALGPLMSVLTVGSQVATMFGRVGAQTDATGRATGRLGGFFRGLFGPIGIIIGILTTLFATNAQFRAGVMSLIQVLGSLIGQVVSALMPVFHALVPIFMQVVHAVLPIVSTLAAALMPVLRVVVGLFARLIAAVLPPLLGLLPAIIPVIAMLGRIIGAVFRALGPVIGLFVRLLGAILPPLLRVLSGVLIPVITTLARVFSAVLGFAIRNVVLPVFNFLRGAVEKIGRLMRWLHVNVIKPVWNAIGTAIQWVWRNVLKPVFDVFVGIAKKIGEAFTGLKKIFGEVFDAIWRIVKVPIQVIIDVVWNKSLRVVVNAARWIADKPALPEIKLAEGGIVPGGYRPGRDTQPAMLSPGEGVLVPEAVRAIGPDAIEAMNRYYARSRPAARYALGGVVGGAPRRRLGAPAAAPGAAGDPVGQASALDATAANLTGTVGSLTTATGTLTGSVQALTADGLVPLRAQVMGKTVPGLAVLETHAGTRATNAVRRLTGTMPVLSNRTAATGGVVRTQWQAMSNRVATTQAAMSGRNRALQTSQLQTGVSARNLAHTETTSWNRITTATRNAVGNITGRQFPNLRSGLNSVGRAFAWTANWVGTSWSRIRGATRGPVAYAIQKPLNGLIGAWNKLNREYGLRKPVSPIRLGFAAGGQVPGVGTRDSVPAMLTPREVVWDTRAVQAAGGPAAVDAMRLAYRSGSLNRASNPAAHRVTASDRLRAMRTASLDDLPVHRAYGGVMPNVAAAGRAVERVFGGLPGGIGGVGARANASDHPIGLALDFMTMSNLRLGDRIAGWLMAHAQRFGLKYLIWKQMINEGTGWSKMEDRGSVTANHFDHVHASFLRPGQRGRAFAGGGMYDPAAIVRKAFAGVVRQARGVGRRFPNTMGEQAGGVALYAIDRVKRTAEKRLNEMMFAGIGGSGVQRWAPLVRRALTMLGLPQGWLGVTLRRMQQESGGDPNIQNNWDSNAAAGVPSQGLMQVIPPTFADWWDPRTPRNIRNPLSNIVASMRYTMDRYGSLPAGYNRSGGYDLGGVASGAGFLAKHTIKPERVLSPRQTQAFDTLAATLGNGRLVVASDVAADDGPMWISGELSVNGLDAHIDGRIGVANDRAGTKFVRGTRT